MMNLCVRGMVVNGDNPKNLVGYIYIGLYAVADFKAVHMGKLDLDFSSSSLLLLLLLLLLFVSFVESKLGLFIATVSLFVKCRRSL